MMGANIARVAAAPLASGTIVEAGQLLFEVENHKVVQEIESPVAGIFVHELAAGDFVYLDAPVAFVASDKEQTTDLLDEARRGKAAADADWSLVVGACPIGLPDAGCPVSIAKATEIAVLGNGAGQSLQATLGLPSGPFGGAKPLPISFRTRSQICLSTNPRGCSRQRSSAFSTAILRMAGCVRMTMSLRASVLMRAAG